MPLPFTREPSRETETHDLPVSEQFKDVHTRASIAALHANLAPEPLSREQLTRQAVVRMFCGIPHEQYLPLLKLSGKDWRRLLKWLDISGLALYFLDRMTELRLHTILPPDILARLQRNLDDNAWRTRGMIAESIAIQQEFQKAYLSYATLKGFSLWPDSVTKLELRQQSDLDFLIAEKDVPVARRILERRGYRLYAVSGRSWEFKANEMPGIPLEDRYKDLSYRLVELHVETSFPGKSCLLDRLEMCGFYGINMPVLAPVDLFLGQGLHLYKHVRSEFSRAAHFLEFYRHVLARRDDDAFWSSLQSACAENQMASFGLGVVTLLITRVMGDFAPEALTKWTVHRLPRAVHLWVEMYGRHTVFDDFPGSKLYLLLQKEMKPAGLPTKRSFQQILLPLRLPPMVIRASTNETLSVRLGRYRMQFHFVLSRIRFHVVEGLRYARESYRWRQMNRLIR